MKKVVKIIIYLLLALLLAVFLYLQNNLLVTTEYSVGLAGLDGELVVVQLSDLHNKVFARDNNKLVSAVEKEEPDIIVITGDLIDMGTPDEKITEYIGSLCPRLAAIAPVYFVSGNHDIDNNYEHIVCELKKNGVTVLDNAVQTIQVNSCTIAIAGVGDLNNYDDWLSGSYLTMEKYHAALDEVSGLSGDNPTILLAHRPEYAEIYAECGFDAVLCGHAHGGQIRLPFVGGLYAPGQGFFPEYAEGVFEIDETTMVVSRGIGNSVIPLRVFNYPEIVSIRFEASA